MYITCVEYLGNWEERVKDFTCFTSTPFTELEWCRFFYPVPGKLWSANWWRAMFWTT